MQTTLNVRSSLRWRNTWVFVAVLFFASVSGASMSLIGGGQTDSPKRYSLLSKLEAVRLGTQVIQDHLIPPPTPGAFYSWKLPEAAEAAQGFRIDQTHYVLLAVGFLRDRLSFVQKNLDQLIPELKNATVEKTQYGVMIPFFPNGFLYSTVDLEVVGAQTFDYGPDGWIVGSRSIRKGGYLWHVGQLGILLKGDEDTKLIRFDKMLTDLDLKDNSSRLYPAELSLSEGKSSASPIGLIIKVAGRTIQLK